MIDLINDQRFLPYLGAVMLQLAMAWGIVLFVRPRVLKFIKEGKERVRRYEAREMRRKMQQSNSKLPKPRSYSCDGVVLQPGPLYYYSGKLIDMENHVGHSLMWEVTTNHASVVCSCGAVWDARVTSGLWRGGPSSRPEDPGAGRSPGRDGGLPSDTRGRRIPPPQTVT